MLCFSVVSSGAAVGPGPGPGRRAQCEHHEGKICQPAAKIKDMLTLWM